MKLEISGHAMERYTERYLCFKFKTKSEQLKYIKDNKLELTYNFVELLNKAELLAHDIFTEKEGKVRHYQIYNEYIFVYSQNKQRVITMYKALMSRDNKENKKLVNKAIKKIRSYRNKLTQLNNKKVLIDDEISHINYAFNQKYISESVHKEKLVALISDATTITKTIKETKNKQTEAINSIIYGHRNIFDEEKKVTNIANEIDLGLR